MASDLTGPQANRMVVPAYRHGCVTDLMPALVGHGSAESLPIALSTSGQRLLLVLDGLGWDQLQDRASVAPTLAAMAGGPITTVAPSTTASALTSITTGLTPAEHGVVGYRMVIDGEVLNCLRWGTKSWPDARTVIPPSSLQPYSPFLGEPLAMVTKAEFRKSGFTEAHLRGGRLSGYRTAALLVHETARLLHEDEKVVYAYYDGIDKVAHEYGLGSEYDAELAFTDRLVADMLASAPAGTTVVITADHGQVDCANGLRPIARDVLSMTGQLSGEGRFRWLHLDADVKAKGGTVDDLAEAAQARHRDQAWVRTLEQIRDEHWFGDSLSDEVSARLGDVALLPFEPVAFADPDDTGPFELIGRHGSLTPAEMLVPCLISTV